MTHPKSGCIQRFPREGRTDWISLNAPQVLGAGNGSISDNLALAACYADTRSAYGRMRQPVRNIHQIIAMHVSVKPPTATRLTATGTSEWPKNAHRNPETR